MNSTVQAMNQYLNIHQVKRENLIEGLEGLLNKKMRSEKIEYLNQLELQVRKELNKIKEVKQEVLQEEPSLFDIISAEREIEKQRRIEEYKLAASR